MSAVPYNVVNFFRTPELRPALRCRFTLTPQGDDISLNLLNQESVSQRAANFFIKWAMITQAVHINSLTDAGTECFKMHETQWCPTCYFLQPIFIHIGVKVAAKHVSAPGFADRLRDVSIIRQTHHVSDLKFTQFVIQVVLSGGWRKYSVHLRLMNIFHSFTKLLSLKNTHSCFQLNFRATFRDKPTHTLFMLQKLESLHPVAPWWSGSQLRNRLSLQVQRWHRVWTIRWTWGGKFILKIYTGNKVVNFKNAYWSLKVSYILLCLILPIYMCLWQDSKAEMDCFFENIKRKTQQQCVFC